VGGYMKKLSEKLVQWKWPILIISLLLLFPAYLGMKATKINYNIMVYLPSDIETMKGEDVLTDDFNMGAFSLALVENMNNKDVLALEDQIKNIDTVEKVESIDDLTGTSIPSSILPSDVVSKLKKGNTTLVLITFRNGTSDQTTLDAIQEIRNITDDRVKLSGTSAGVLDTMNLTNKEIPIYVAIAVTLCIIVLFFCLDSYLVPFILILNIGVAILYNMGTNIFLGNISYITQAIAAVLQLGVTTDFSIFLYHSYEGNKKKYKNKDEAMANAIVSTFNSVLGSSLTTIAGFLALCTMTLLLGKDIGIVMAKGVFFGVVTVLTLFPSLILIFDHQIDHTIHKEWLPEFNGIKHFVVKYYKQILVIFLILWIPAIIGNNNVKVYYDLDRSLPKDLPSMVAINEAEEKFNIVSPEMILVNKDMKSNEVMDMVNEIKNIDGIDYALTYAQVEQSGIPDDIIPKDIINSFKSDKYQMIIINSNYKLASTELNNQIEQVDNVIKKYDDKAILAGEGPLTKDLIKISDVDFRNVNYTSIAIIFIIMCFVLKSASLPIILVLTIEFAIFMNMSTFYYTGVTLPFVANIIIGTIQLGATIDYAILMTNKFLEKRKSGADKFESIHYALDNSVKSVLTSGLCFFAATFGVAIYSKIDIIGSICHLIARGAIISMLTVILVLPSLLILCDPIIIRTTKGFKKGFDKMKIDNKKVALATLCLGMMIPFSVGATSKNETVYQIIDENGNTQETTVTEELQDVTGDVVDETDLENILNINGDESYFKNDNNITWKSNGTNIYYQGTTTKKLPIDISVKYYLDNEQTSIQELNGKSGHIKIQINYNNLEKHGNLYTPFVVTMGTIIDNENNSNISINNGKVVSNGKQSVIVGISTPNLSESLNIKELEKLNYLTIEYDTTNFKQTDIYNVYSPKLLDTDDLKVFDKLDTIYDDVDNLSSASTKLVNGANTLNNGMNQYKTNLKTYKDGVAQAYAGSKKINKAVNSSIETLNNTSAIDADTLSQIKAAAKKTAEDTVNATFTENYKDTIGKQAVSAFVTNIENYRTSYNQVLASKGITAGTPAEATFLQGLKMAVTSSTLDPATLKNYQGILQMYAAITEYDANPTVVQNFVYSTAVNTAYNTALQTAENTAESTAEKVATGVANNAKDQTITSLTTLSNGLTDLTNGLSKINNATGKLYSATEELNDGTTKLADGLEKFDSEGIQKIADYANGDIKTLEDNLKGLEQLGKDYDTFTKKTSKMTGETKFIVKIEANQN
jgi:uncharacterized protein